MCLLESDDDVYCKCEARNIYFGRWNARSFSAAQKRVQVRDMMDIPGEEEHCDSSGVLKYRRSRFQQEWLLVQSRLYMSLILFKIDIGHTSCFV